MPLTNDHAAVSREAWGLKLGLSLHLHPSVMYASKAGRGGSRISVKGAHMCKGVCVFHKNMGVLSNTGPLKMYISISIVLYF